MKIAAEKPQSVMGRRKGTGNQAIQLGVLLDNFSVRDDILVPYKFLEKHGLIKDEQKDDSDDYYNAPLFDDE